MMSSSVHTRSLRSTLQAILWLQSAPDISPITQEQIATAADISLRQVANCLLGLKVQEVLRWDRDSQWSGPGIRYCYTVNLKRAFQYEYVNRDFIDLLDLKRQRLMAEAA